jgi:hypothetical protein
MIDPVTIAKLWLAVKPIKRIRAARNKRRARKGKPLLDVDEEIHMGAYSKLWVMLAGSIIAVASRWIPALEGADAEAVVQSVLLLLTALGVWGVPNKPTSK